MSIKRFTDLPDHTPIIVGAGQHSEAIQAGVTPLLSAPMHLAAEAAKLALEDAGGSSNSRLIDTIAVIRLFSDSVPAWSCPFGGSENPPESIARRIGSTPQQRIYSTAGGSQPLEVLAELLGAIARGETEMALLAGAEAIGSQRYALRQGLEPDWRESFDVAMDSREYTRRFVAPEELSSGMFQPAHYYALIENHRAHTRGRNLAQQRLHMGQMMAPFSRVALSNPHAVNATAYEAQALASTDNGNYPICLPYTKRLVAQDAVNQAAALILTSVGKARELGIDPEQWIFLQGYARGSDRVLSRRLDPGSSLAMTQVIQGTLKRAGASPADLDLIDIYSCFPCAVEAACESIALPTDGSRDLTVTGGLPFFGGPGNNYSTHAMAEMVQRLRHTGQRGLVTANGGQLSKHAAVVMANSPHAEGVSPMDWMAGEIEEIDPDNIPCRDFCDSPGGGEILSYTVIHNREKPDLAVVLAETASGERFLARNNSEAVTASMQQSSPIGRAITVTRREKGHGFDFVA